MIPDYEGLYKPYVGKFKITQNGRQATGLCPFHDDTHQSLGFNELGLYNCFTCGAKGNAISMAKYFNENPRPFYSDDYKKPNGLINNGKATQANL